MEVRIVDCYPIARLMMRILTPNIHPGSGVSQAMKILGCFLTRHVGVAGKLVAAGVDRCVVDNESNNALHLAATSGCAEAVSHILGLEVSTAKEPVTEEVLLAVGARSSASLFLC